jgi:hypothetical protein
MIRRKGVRRLFIGVAGILAMTLFGFIVMGLWNWIVPPVIGWKALTFWQALGLLVLSRILLGGFFRPNSFGERRRARRMMWEQMTPEQREKFRAAGMEHRCGGSPQPSA